MFNNRFNSSKRDPLVEAVEGAMKDGELRRQAIAHVNEQFGVFNRNAVIREELAAYDAAIEEAYKCMKEDEKMADKDYDGDGKIETSKKEVWGSRLRAAKASGKYKGPVDEKKDCYEESDGLPPSDAAKQAGATQQSQTPSSTPKRTGNAAGSTISNARAATGMQEAQLDELKKPTAKTAMKAYYRAYDSDVQSGEGARSSRLGSWKQKHLPGKSARNQKDTGKAELPDYSEKATKAEIKSRLGKHTKANLPEEVMKESIVAKLFAKHVKEDTQIDEVSAFGQAFRAAGGKNFTFGGKEYSGARADAKSSTPTPPSRPAGLGASKSIGDTGYKSGQTVSLKPIGDTGSAMAADNKPEPARPAPTPGWKAPAPVDQSKTIEKSGGTAPVAAPKEAPMPPSRPANLGGGEAAGLPKIDTGPKLNANKPGLQESVQIGENKYRIF